MNSSREGGGNFFGQQTAGVAFGGSPGPAVLVEHYNGTSWTEAGNDLPTAGAQGGGSGSLTAGLAFGFMPTDTDGAFKYNGTTWTATGNLNEARS